MNKKINNFFINFIYFFVSLFITIVHYIAFTSLSDLCLAISSTPSLIIYNPITITKGTTALYALNGDIDGIDYNIAINKKYMFAY